VDLAVPAQTALAVSLYASGPTGPATYHSDAQHLSYVSVSGDHAASLTASAFPVASSHWYFLTEVDILARFDRDTARVSGARYVILLEGINDIETGRTTAAGIVAGYQDLIAQAHAAGLVIIGATLTPYQGSVFYSAAGEAERQAVNRWIRTSGAFDGVVDFDRAVRDPADPVRLFPGYDSGDHIHPDDAGYQAMAGAVSLNLVRP
jgi:lysophospholipase L1-like esterase